MREDSKVFRVFSVIFLWYSISSFKDKDDEEKLWEFYSTLIFRAHNNLRFSTIKASALTEKFPIRNPKCTSRCFTLPGLRELGNTFNFDAKLPCLVAPGGSGALYFFEDCGRGRLALTGTGMPDDTLFSWASETKTCYSAYVCSYILPVKKIIPLLNSKWRIYMDNTYFWSSLNFSTNICLLFQQNQPFCLVKSNVASIADL